MREVRQVNEIKCSVQYTCVRAAGACEVVRRAESGARQMVRHALRLDEVVEYVVRAVRDAELRDARVGRREEHLRHREALRVHLQHLLAQCAYEYIAVLHDNVSTATRTMDVLY